jgi:hypothetical protein
VRFILNARDKRLKRTQSLSGYRVAKLERHPGIADLKVCRDCLENVAYRRNVIDQRKIDRFDLRPVLVWRTRLSNELICGFKMPVISMEFVSRLPYLMVRVRFINVPSRLILLTISSPSRNHYV